MVRKDWCLVSCQGAVLFYIALHPRCTIADISRAMGLTPRAVWENVNSLRREGMLRVQTQRRLQHFTVNLDAAFLHPTISGFTLRPFLTSVIAQSLARQAEEAAPAEPEREPSLALSR